MLQAFFGMLCLYALIIVAAQVVELLSTRSRRVESARSQAVESGL